MLFIKRFLYHFTATVHKLLVLALPVVFALAILLSGPTYIQKALKESRVYDQFVSSVLDKSQKEATDQNAKDILAQPEIQAAAQKAFTPTLLESSTNNVLEGVFAWAQGKTTEPEFRIDLTNAKAELAAGVVAYAEKRANSLPACTLAQLRTLDPNIDLLEVPCLPPGVNVSAQAQTYGQKFLNDSDFLKDPVITNQTITKQNNGEPLSEKLDGVPQAYSALNAGKWILFSLVVLLSALLVFARKDRRAGAKHVAWTLLSVGVFFVIIMIVYWFVFDRAQTARAVADATQAMWVDGAKSLITDFNRVLTKFSIGYIVIGGTILGLLRLRPVDKELAKAPEPVAETETPQQPIEEAVEPTEKKPE